MDKPGQPQQEALWHDDINDATRTCIAALGGPKRVGSMLWPDEPIEKAAQKLNRCLQDDRREVLHVNQYLLIWREAVGKGCLAGIAQANRECNCADPIPVSPEDEHARLQRDFVEATKYLRTLGTELERVEQRMGRAE